MQELNDLTLARALTQNHHRALALLRELYVEATGLAEVADTLSPGAMMNEIDDKMLEEQKQEIFQRLARERAGLSGPPAADAHLSPAERMYRMLTTMGDQLEQEIGREIGPDLARRYRELKGGFGSRSRHRSGCPRP